MIEWLKIKNLALIQDAEIEFKEGLNIISGETGAGKSVIINALSLLFGERADKNIIRTDEAKCELSATLKIPDYAVTDINKILDKYSISSLNDNREIVLRRIITQNSSRQFINDINVTLNVLEVLSNLLIDFHGPDQHQSLLKNNSILAMIDSSGKLSKNREHCEKLYYRIKNIEEEITKLEESFPKQNEIEYYKHTVNEIKTVNPIENEDIELNTRYNLAANCKNIIETATVTKNHLYDSEESVYNILGNINKKLSNISIIDPENINKFTTSISAITSQIKDIAYDLENYSSKIELNDAEYAELETRLNLISGLKKRYGPTIKNVLDNLRSAQDNLYLYENSASIRQKLSETLRNAKNEYMIVAGELSTMRKKISKTFINDTKAKLKLLGFLQAEMSAVFTENQISSSGIDKLEIFFSANPGEKLSPLDSVASSGELSRIMLAIKSILSAADKIPILIFDEIDANIGGEIGKEVGKELKRIGRKHQIICISHLPQVASFADHHLQVKKNIIEKRTITTISALSEQEKVLEISRMLGGGKAAKIHAKEIVNSSE